LSNLNDIDIAIGMAGKALTTTADYANKTTSLISSLNNVSAKLQTTPSTITLTNLFSSAIGQFTAADGNADGWSDNWKTSYAGTLASYVNGKQSFTPQQRWGNMALNVTPRTALRGGLTNGDKVFAIAIVKTTDAKAFLQVNGCGANNVFHSGSGRYEYLYGIYTVTDATQADFSLASAAESGWVTIYPDEVSIFKINGSSATADQIADIVIDNGFITSGTFNIPDKVYLGRVSDVFTTAPNVSIEVDVASPVGSAGIAMCLNDYVNPTNYLMAYITDKSRVRLKKYVGGVPSLLIDEAITVASGKLKVVKVGKVVKLYFAGSQIGTDITIKDFAIRYGKNHCLFATDTSTKFKSFTASNLASDALTTFLWGSDVHIGNTDSSILTNPQFAAAFGKMDEVTDADFLLLTGDVLNDGYTSNPNYPAQISTYNKVSSVYTKPIKVFRGNHDDGTVEFPKHGVVEKNGVRIIYFWADFVIVSEGVSTGDVTAAELAWIEDQLKVPATHKILACHYSIVTNDATNFIWPITDDHGRLSVLALAEEYGVKLYMNGHEHMPNLPTGTAGVLTDVQTASICSATQGAFNVCTVYTDKIVIDAYRDVSPFTYITSKEISLV
jgi:hypothetical protein